MSKDDIQIIEAESFNWTSECNNCHKTIYWCHCVRHRKTKRHLPMNNEYHEGEQVNRHMCMKYGGLRAGYINKYEYSPSAPILNVDTVDKRTLEIEHKRWLETVGYQPLNEWELEQVEFGRKYRETFVIKK